MSDSRLLTQVRKLETEIMVAIGMYYLDDVSEHNTRQNLREMLRIAAEISKTLEKALKQKEEKEK